MSNKKYIHIEEQVYSIQAKLILGNSNISSTMLKVSYQNPTKLQLGAED
jgi:hypothetical protein